MSCNFINIYYKSPGLHNAPFWPILNEKVKNGGILLQLF